MMRNGIKCWTARLAAPVVLLATAMPAAAAGGAEFYFGDPGQAVISILIFLLLLAVLGKWAWKPLVSQLQRREQGIAEALEHAQARNKEADDLLAQYKARLDAAQAQAAELLAKSRADAAEAREKILSAAQSEAHRAGESARQEIERAKLDALAELQDTTARLATDVAARVIRKNLSDDDQRRLLSDSLAEIRQRAAR